MFDSTGKLFVLPVLGWYLDYEHAWVHVEALKKLSARSSLIWSYVGVDNVPAQAEDAYEHTNRLVGNMVVSPSPRLDVGVEYIWGERTNLDGQSGTSSQIQFVGYFRF